MCHRGHVDRGQRTTREGQFSPSTIQDPGLNPGCQVGGRCLYLKVSASLSGHSCDE